PRGALGTWAAARHQRSAVLRLAGRCGRERECHRRGGPERDAHQLWGPPMRLPTSVITRKTSRAPTAVIRAVGLSIGLVFAAGCPSSTTVHYEWSGVP